VRHLDPHALQRTGFSGGPFRHKGVAVETETHTHTHFLQELYKEHMKKVAHISGKHSVRETLDH
jgi:hypothetical protein